MNKLVIAAMALGVIASGASAEIVFKDGVYQSPHYRTFGKTGYIYHGDAFSTVNPDGSVNYDSRDHFDSYPVDGKANHLKFNSRAAAWVKKAQKKALDDSFGKLQFGNSQAGVKW